jgi:hypothetical protein
VCTRLGAKIRKYFAKRVGYVWKKITRPKRILTNFSLHYGLAVSLASELETFCLCDGALKGKALKELKTHNHRRVQYSLRGMGG